MRATTRRELIAGPAGKIECVVDEPGGSARGIALVAHPHPLFGGTVDNKVAQTLARAFVDLGYTAWRPNFRGVGASEGSHDEGRGEVDDLAAVPIRARRMRLVGRTLAGSLFSLVTPGEENDGQQSEADAAEQHRRQACQRDFALRLLAVFITSRIVALLGRTSGGMTTGGNDFDSSRNAAERELRTSRTSCGQW